MCHCYALAFQWTLPLTLDGTYAGTATMMSTPGIAETSVYEHGNGCTTELGREIDWTPPHIDSPQYSALLRHRKILTSEHGRKPPFQCDAHDNLTAQEEPKTNKLTEALTRHGSPVCITTSFQKAFLRLGNLISILGFPALGEFDTHVHQFTYPCYLCWHIPEFHTVFSQI